MRSDMPDRCRKQLCDTIAALAKRYNKCTTLNLGDYCDVVILKNKVPALGRDVPLYDARDDELICLITYFEYYVNEECGLRLWYADGVLTWADAAGEGEISVAGMYNVLALKARKMAELTEF